MEWFSHNQKWIILVLLLLLMIKSFQSCNRKMEVKRTERILNHERDSLFFNASIIQDSLVKEIIIRDNIIKNLTYEVKIAEIKVNEAEKRAEAVQKAAEKIRTNTTIRIEGADEKKNTK